MLVSVFLPTEPTAENKAGSPLPVPLPVRTFPGSLLIAAEWEETLSGWVGSSVPEGEWTLCYSSFTDNATTPAAFHAQCDNYTTTVSVAHNKGDGGSNAGNYTFGGFAAGSWNYTVCCANPRNDCHRPDHYTISSFCTDQTTTDDFLFGLWTPGREGDEGPQRCLPTGTGTDFQFVAADLWPAWGSYSDLSMGYGGPLGGDHGYCNQGNTYAGFRNEICGGQYNWGATQLEVWRPACTSCGGHGVCDHITRVCACAAGYRLSNVATCVADRCYEKTCFGHGSCEPFADCVNASVRTLGLGQEETVARHYPRCSPTLD